MRFLVDANLPRSSLRLFQTYGHGSEHVRDLGLGDSADSVIAGHAKAIGAALVTRDLDFANIRAYPPEHYDGLLVIRLFEDATASQILRLLERFLRNSELVDKIPRHLVILEADQVRFRPPI